MMKVFSTIDYGSLVSAQNRNIQSNYKEKRFFGIILPIILALTALIISVFTSDSAIQAYSLLFTISLLSALVSLIIGHKINSYEKTSMTFTDFFPFIATGLILIAFI